VTLPPTDVVLRDGSTVRVRPVRTDDADAVLAFLEAMSPESRRLRFFSAAADLRGAAHRAASVTERRGFGLVATTGDPPSIVAHAAYERIDDDRAELAFEVADSLRGRGLGTLLMAHLAGAARDQNISSFYADVLPENRRMLEVFQESGFPVELERTREGIGVELTTQLSLEALEAFEERERIAAAAAMRHFLEPESVAVVGASRREGSVGGAVLGSILRSGFAGPVYPVNPRAQIVAGQRAYASVSELPEVPELAVVAVRAESVPDVARDCAMRGVSSLLVLSAGFAEAGAEGAGLQDELVAVCRAAGMRLVGPNCLGLMGRRRPLDATFVPHAAPPGRVALLSQSGGVGLALIEQAAALGLGLSSFVSIGNRPDISANDVLEYWEDDDSTDVVLVYLESFGNPRNFVRIARRLARRKPIVALRAGRSGAGARAAASHTGAVVAASDAGIEALFGQAGIVRADTLGELFDVGALLASQPPPSGRRVGLVTNAGGPAILCADACEAGGLVLPEPSEDLRARLAEHLPAHASTRNPVDMLAAAGPEEFDAVLRTLAGSGEVDALVALFTPALNATADAVQDAIDAVARDVAVPIVSVVFGATDAKEDGGGAAQFSYPEGAARALSAVARLAEWRQAPPDDPPHFGDARPGEATELLAAAVSEGGRWLSDAEVTGLLEAWGVPLVETVRAATPAEAGRAAATFGGPVAVKAVGEGILHKTDLGAVQTGLEGEQAVRRSAQGMSRRLRRRGLPPGGFLVQRYVTGGVEMLAGITVDPLLGPLVACAAGGTVVELIGDVSVRLAPIGSREAAEMVRSLSTFPLLDGYRGARPADVSALEDLLTRLGALAAAHPEIVELDCNPVMVLERGAVVVDARVRVAPPGPRPLWPALGAEPPAVGSFHGPTRRHGAEAARTGTP
jgi:acyl-CoA synthetase (NDP forming)/ribosomal protein S18 acetylase RimI-like enzyme